MRKRAGCLTVVCGSMYAGKTEEMIRRARRALYAKKRVQVFKCALDDRFDKRMVVTHLGQKYEAAPVSSVPELHRSIDDEADMVCVDEVQFFDRSICDLCMDLADEGKEIVVAGLDQDFRRRPFGPMGELLALADEVVKLRAICMASGQPASHTYRIIDGRPAHTDDPIVLIGATESYEARARSHYKLRGEPKKRYEPPSGSGKR